MEGPIGPALRRGGEEAAYRVSVEMTTRVRVESETTADDYCGMLYKAAFHEDLNMVRALLAEGDHDQGRVASDVWEVNPLRGVILAQKTRISLAEVLLHHYGHGLLLKARDPVTGNTLLHLAAQHQKEDLAIFFLKYLAKLKKKKQLDPFIKQGFLDAVNSDGQTALHVATVNLLYGVAHHLIVSQKQLKINIKDKAGKTALDLIKVKCDDCHIKDDWRTPWKISILLRSSHARPSSELKDYQDEEVPIKSQSPKMEGERRLVSIMLNDDMWNVLTTMILAIATLAFAFIFAAIFTVPQTLASGGGGGGNTNFGMVIKGLHNSLGKSIAFRVFVVSLSLACLLMILVVIVTVSTISAVRFDMRALILAISWICFIITGVALAIAYLIAIWLYMGYFFTSILIASCAFIALVLLLLAYFFDLVEPFWISIADLLSLTLLYGYVVTFLHSFCPKCCRLST